MDPEVEYIENNFDEDEDMRGDDQEFGGPSDFGGPGRFFGGPGRSGRGFGGPGRSFRGPGGNFGGPGGPNRGGGPGFPRGDNFGGGGFKDRYNDAYGNYQGGYGMKGGMGLVSYPNVYGPPMRPPGPPGPFGPMGPPMMGPGQPPFHPGFGYGNFGGGPVFGNINKNFNFLMRCGMTSEAAQAIPKKCIRLYTADHCGVCKMDMLSFSFARMHYLSKNHMKNQKKWIAESAEASKQSPMKSREIYCELCDVQITSKVHADSHYSGKAHRAVVKGSRAPKNPKLLGNPARVNKLIRREKRCLPQEPVVEEKEGDTPKKTPTDEKPSSEFYCEICKSSMSCSEQMTAHLNGKRHLAKEKQHILRMMKGDKSKEKKVSGGEGDGQEGGEEESQNGNNGGDGGEGEEDWVNGTGEWESQEGNGDQECTPIQN